MKVFLLFLSIVLFTIKLNAQQILNENDKIFAFRVKQIDEFIQRFNFDTTGQNILKDFYDKNGYNNPDTFNRAYFIKTLFDVKNGIDIDLANEFISNVDSSDHKVYLSFYDENWYAVLNCNFIFMNKNVGISLVLKNQVKKEKTSKWVVCGVKSDFLKEVTSTDSTKILSPMSHGIDFINLDKALLDKKNLSNYFPTGFHSDQLGVLYFLMEKNILSFSRINSIEYFFFQIPNWVLKVNYFNRDTANSGWLISSFSKMGSQEKERFKEEQLNLFSNE